MLKTFLVDDSLVVQERLRTILSELTEVRIIGQAHDATEAMLSIRKLKPDVVVLDIRMPKGNGLDVLQHIKGGQPAPAVIILTNYPYPQIRKKCMEAGADFFFDKSTEFESLPGVFRQLIRNSYREAADIFWRDNS